MNKYREDRKKALIKILVDSNALDAERDDAAMDLGDDYDDEIVLNALIEIAKNPEEVDMITNTCGEGIGRIWVVKGYFDLDVYNNLSKPAQDGIYCTIHCMKPLWIDEYRLG